MMLEGLTGITKSSYTGDDLISRQAAINAIENTDCELSPKDWDELTDAIVVLPFVDRPTVDCTKFMEWLKAEVLDEENWELNAVANGEVICRKFKKMGWLDVEDGFYVDVRPTGEWKQVDLLADRLCSVCGYGVWDSEAEEYNYCPNCGAKMEDNHE